MPLPADLAPVDPVDGHRRCFWCHGHDDYRRYHDEEWGVPVTADHRLFEKLCLEGFQAGLSWLTILRKRDHFRAAFRDFELDRVARFDRRSVERLLGDAGIVRHRGKIESAINNARRARELRAEFGDLAAYFWRHRVDGPFPGTIPAATPVSTALSEDLKRRGWSFVGPTTVYAFMQAMGLVNDHPPACPRRAVVEALRARAPAP